MRFCDFIQSLYDCSPRSSKIQFILEVFSALCGEPNPAGANQDASNRTKAFIYSKYLPDGLTGQDSTYRKRLYGGTKYNGLSAPIKTHIQGHKCRDTFINYFDETISEQSFPKMCEKFSATLETQRQALFYGLYEQF